MAALEGIPRHATASRGGDWLIMWDRDWANTMYREHTWDKLTRSVRMCVARYILSGPRPEVCPGCGKSEVYLWSVSGKCLDDPLDYHYQCRKCHSIKPTKYPGRPKGSKNKTTTAKKKAPDWWEQKCAEAEKELYGSESCK